MPSPIRHSLILVLASAACQCIHFFNPYNRLFNVHAYVESISSVGHCFQALDAMCLSPLVCEANTPVQILWALLLGENSAYPTSSQLFISHQAFFFFFFTLFVIDDF